MEKEFIIQEKELRRLLENQNTLSKLEFAGVDNWAGYGEAMSEDYSDMIDEIPADLSKMYRVYDNSNEAKIEKLKKYLKDNEWEYVYLDCKFLEIPQYNDIKAIIEGKKDLLSELKDLVENRYDNKKVVWFDSEYAKVYGELCDIAGAGDTRTALVPLDIIRNIIKEYDK